LFSSFRLKQTHSIQSNSGSAKTQWPGESPAITFSDRVRAV